MEESRIKEILIRENEEFKTLTVEHQECERQLMALDGDYMKTDNERFKEMNLKKQKLKLKDSMQQYISDFKRRQVG